MPIYEYSCKNCGDEFEQLIFGAEQPQCPQCASEEVTKQFSVPAAHTNKGSSLPIASPPAGGGCGLPQCGPNRCAGMQ